jgi:hypothetical protein
MDWNAVGAIGEVGGAVGVIVTLVYLAGQLKQNTNALKSASYEHWNMQVAEWSHFQGQHASELADAKRVKSLEEATPEQWSYLAGEFQIVMSQGECAFLKHRAGALDDDVFESRIQALLEYFEINPVMRRAWLEREGLGYTPDFAKFLNERMQLAG